MPVAAEAMPPRKHNPGLKSFRGDMGSADSRLCYSGSAIHPGSDIPPGSVIPGNQSLGVPFLVEVIALMAKMIPFLWKS